MIEIKQLSFSYAEEKILDALSLSFPQASSTAILGRSGCGKTTLLKLLAGLLPCGKGSLLIRGKIPEDIPEGLAYIQQNLGLFPWKTVEENLDLVLKLRKQEKAQRQQRLESILKEFQLKEVKNAYPRNLSGGQAQRTAIARALLQEADILLMDEPSASLDALSREAFQDFLKALQARRPSTRILVTHSIEEAVVLGERILILYKGGQYTQFENPLYALQNSRSQPEYGPFCQEIRKALGTASS